MTKLRFKLLLGSLMFFSLSVKCPANLEPQIRIPRQTES
jgi:hypothetical protein